MADIDLGTGPDTDSGDTLAQALAKLEARLAAKETNGTPAGYAVDFGTAVGTGDLAATAFSKLTYRLHQITLPVLALGVIADLTTATAAGTLIATIGAVPTGVTPTILPGDGRLVIAGSAGAGWKIVRGMTAVSAGEIDFTISAAGARGVSGSVTITAPSAGVAQITSSAAISQPGATLRYQRATADRPGTWSKGSGGDAASFTLDAATGIYSIAEAAAGDGSAQLVRTLPLVFTPADGTGPMTQTVSLTLTPIAAPSIASVIYNASFVGAAGTPLESLPGWSVDAAGIGHTPTLDGNGNLVGNDTSASAGFQVLYDLGGQAPGSRVTFTIEKPAATGFIEMLMGWDGAGSGLLYWSQAQAAQLNFGNGLYLLDAANGNQTVSPSSAIQAWRGDGTIDVVFEIAQDGKTASITINGAGTFTQTFDTSKTALGTKFGFNSPGPNNPAIGASQTIKAIQALRAATTLMVASGGAPTYTATNQATFALTWGRSKPVAIQYRLYDENNIAPLTPWMTSDAAIGNDSTISATVTAPGGGAYTARFRPLNDTPVEAVASNTTAFLSVVEPFAWGGNVAAARYYDPINMLNDWGKVADIRPGTNAIHVQYAGITTMSGQTDTVQTDVGVTLAGDNTTLFVDHSDPSTGTHIVRVTGDAAPDDRAFAWSGIRPTFFTVTRGGIVGKIAPEFLAGMDGSALRDLDMIGTNLVTMQDAGFPAPLVTDKNYVQPGGVFYPFEDVIDAVVALNAHRPDFDKYWHTIRTDMSDAEVAHEAAYARDHLPNSGFRQILQFGNEFFNEGAGFDGSLRARADGVRHGFYGDATFDNPKPAKAVYAYNPYGQFAPATKAGDWIMTVPDGYDYSIWEAKRDVPAATAFKTVGPGDDWLYRADIDPLEASHRWEAIRFNQIIDIWKNVWGAERYEKQVFPVVMGAVKDGELSAQLQTQRTYVPGFWDKIKGTGYAWYWSEAPGYDYSNSDPAVLAAAIRSGLPIVKASTASVVSSCLKMGKVACLYEGGAGSNGYGVNPFTATWDAVMTSDAGKALWAEMGAYMKATVPGLVMLYTGAGVLPWGLKRTWGDNTNPKRLGWLDGIGG